MTPDFNSAMRSPDSLRGTRVESPAHAALGRIEDLIVDVPAGRVAYAALCCEAFPDLDDRLLAVPWEMLAFDEGRGAFILDVNPDVLRAAPYFLRGNRARVADVDWLRGAYIYWGVHLFVNAPAETTRYTRPVSKP
ncbi:MAG: PRC-barrel domain containing protein [Chloroflexi bacterium]|nr:PRC-barrel domain containing protein [Chloroflexota bacterium]